MLQSTSTIARKLAQSVAGQNRAAVAWADWARNTRLHSTRLWIHAPSIGEGIVAEPVIERLVKSNIEPMTVIRTFTSPSAAAWVGSFPYDRSDYLPIGRSLTKLFRIIRPTALVYPRADFWPALISLAVRHNVPQVVIGGQLRSDSRRLKWPARRLTGRWVEHMRAIGAVNENDCRLWRQLGATADQITVTGDPRDAQVLERIGNPRWASTISDWANGDFVLIGGSIHRGDEKHVLQAAANIRGRVIVVPHEPSGPTVRRVMAHCERLGLTHSVVGDIGERPLTDSQVLIVGATGGLQDLYAAASIAFVGGGFGGTRLHSLSEPAALGLPIVFGPGGRADPSAARFLANGSARVVLNHRDLETACDDFCDERVRRGTGLKARVVLDAGAAAKTVDLLRRVLTDCFGQQHP